MTATWTLRRHQIERLEKYRLSHRLDVVQFKLAMEGAPFTYGTLARALRGSAIQESSYRFIVEWLDRFVPGEGTHGKDRKSLAAGDSDDSNEEVAARADDAIPCSE